MFPQYMMKTQESFGTPLSLLCLDSPIANISAGATIWEWEMGNGFLRGPLSPRLMSPRL